MPAELRFRAGVATLVTGLLTGLAPALQAGRGDLATALKAGAREGTYDRSRTRAGLLLLQGALSVVLLVGAGLFVRSLSNVRSLRRGYDVDPILYVWPNMRGLKLSDAERVALIRRLHDAAKSLPGVPNASVAATVPFWNILTQQLSVPGVDSVGRLGSFTQQTATPDYFATMGTRLLRGRGLEASDRKGTPLVMVVSDGMARTLWPAQDAIGKCVTVGCI